MQEFIVFFFLLGLCITEAFNGRPLWAPLLFLLGFLLALYLRRKRHQQRTDFINQLKSHRRELRGGGTVFVDSLMLRYNTVVTTYNLSIGVVLLNIVIPSRHKIADGDDHGESLLYSVLSIISGWWAFPAGPVITLSVIKRNLSGGDKVSVGQLIDAPLLDALSDRGMTTALAVSSHHQNKQEARHPASPSTGRGSRSDRMLSRRRPEAENISTSQRIADLDKPPPPGVVLSRYVQARVERWRDDTRRRVSRALSHRKREQSKSDKA